MLGCVETEGKLVTSQYFYNFTTNVSLSFLHLQCLATVESKGTLGFMDNHPTQGEGREGEGHLNAEDQLNTCGTVGLTLKVMGCGRLGCAF